MLQITDNAVNKVKELLSAEKKNGYGLRVAVQGGGCSGFQYGLNLEEEPREDDEIVLSNGIRLFVDPFSSQYLPGTVRSSATLSSPSRSTISTSSSISSSTKRLRASWGMALPLYARTVLSPLSFHITTCRATPSYSG